MGSPAIVRWATVIVEAGEDRKEAVILFLAVKQELQSRKSEGFGVE
jgi:hypothetical protein